MVHLPKWTHTPMALISNRSSHQLILAHCTHSSHFPISLSHSLYPSLLCSLTRNHANGRHWHQSPARWLLGHSKIGCALIRLLSPWPMKSQFLQFPVLACTLLHLPMLSCIPTLLRSSPQPLYHTQQYVQEQSLT